MDTMAVTSRINWRYEEERRGGLRELGEAAMARRRCGEDGASGFVALPCLQDSGMYKMVERSRAAGPASGGRVAVAVASAAGVGGRAGERPRNSYAVFPFFFFSFRESIFLVLRNSFHYLPMRL
jgi:hypothetical protein